MSHKFTKGAQDHACGMITLMLDAIENHRKEFGNMPPVFFLLHPGSSALLNGEHYKRYGVPHAMQFAGVPIKLCQCQGPHRIAACDYPIDRVAYMDGSLRDL
jgi:hypothetical protein